MWTLIKKLLGFADAQVLTGADTLNQAIGVFTNAHDKLSEAVDTINTELQVNGEEHDRIDKEYRDAKKDLRDEGNALIDAKNQAVTTLKNVKAILGG